MSEIGQKLIEQIRRIADIDPGFVYTGRCNYVVDGQPGCIVGRAAWKLDLIDASFQDNSANNGGINDLEIALGLQLDQDESSWLAEAQDFQDQGIPWGQVPGKADAYLADRYDNDDQI